MLRTTLRQIEVFVATAQKGNVTQAAGMVGLTQSAASMALADFENQLGTKLFDRIGKRLSLNEEGRILYAKAVDARPRAGNGSMFRPASAGRGFAAWRQFHYWKLPVAATDREIHCWAAG